jgi:hypothetical protein
MKKIFAALVLAAAAASPALASDASDAMHAQVQPAYATMWNGAYASAQNVTWHQATSLRRQAELDAINR